ncbi:MAG: hypothetical protein QM530_00780 [Phycisphaerales bacterium]|nr:hypothetical protein [Phycisphaerales bacterium]
MKSLSKIILSVLFVTLIVSCATSEGNMKVMTQMKDSISANYPTVASIIINVQNNDNLVIALGSEDLYGADEMKRQQIANDLASMALRLFGKDSKLEHGKIIVTQNETNQEAEPRDGLVSQMDFLSVRKAQ